MEKPPLFCQWGYHSNRSTHRKTQGEDIVVLSSLEQNTQKTVSEIGFAVRTKRSPSLSDNPDPKVHLGLLPGVELTCWAMREELARLLDGLTGRVRLSNADPRCVALSLIASRRNLSSSSVLLLAVDILLLLSCRVFRFAVGFGHVVRTGFYDPILERPSRGWSCDPRVNLIRFLWSPILVFCHLLSGSLRRGSLGADRNKRLSAQVYVRVLLPSPFSYPCCHAATAASSSTTRLPPRQTVKYCQYISLARRKSPHTAALTDSPLRVSRACGEPL